MEAKVYMQTKCNLLYYVYASLALHHILTTVHSTVKVTCMYIARKHASGVRAFLYVKRCELQSRRQNRAGIRNKA